MSEQVIDETMEKVLKAIEAIHALPGIKIELAGAWVWVSGNTAVNKDALKAAGYKWAHKKKLWYFPGTRSAGRGKDMSYIRSKYGSVIVNKE